MSLNSLDSTDLDQSCLVVQYNVVQSFAPVTTGSKAMHSWGNSLHTHRGTTLSFAAECCIPELCNGSLEAFQALAEVSKLVFG